MRPWFYDDRHFTAEEVGTATRTCAHAGCREAGDYRAPKSPRQPKDYLWFCLDHVKAYNAKWDYAKGLGPDEIENLIRFDAIWQRETRPLGDWRSREKLLRASANAFRADPAQKAKTKPADPTLPEPVASALALFTLDLPVTPEQLRTRYRELVKRHHPDMNGGSKAAEDRIKDINLAYTALREFLQGS